MSLSTQGAGHPFGFGAGSSTALGTAPRPTASPAQGSTYHDSPKAVPDVR
jgi:hypothetical protein